MAAPQAPGAPPAPAPAPAPGPGGPHIGALRGWQLIGTGAMVLATGFMAVAIWLSAKHIMQHFRGYTKPDVQRVIVRILIMVPVYSLTCWLSLIYPPISDGVEAIRGIYEAFVIWMFFHLLMQLLGGEEALVRRLQERRMQTQHPIPCRLVFSPLDLSSRKHFVLIKRGVLQYSLLRPILTAITFFFRFRGTYHDGKLGLHSPWMYTFAIQNMCVSTAMYSLVMFYQTTKVDLKDHQPLPKFLCIKGIIFATFWQSILVHLATSSGVLHDEGPYSAGLLARAIQDFLITAEMIGFSIYHRKAFSHLEYAPEKTGAQALPPLEAFNDFLRVEDIVQEASHTLAGRWQHDESRAVPSQESNQKDAADTSAVNRRVSLVASTSVAGP